ncbi:hypothetical protein AALP_AA2G194400 [Arabis alpina]|uniref:HhH-GPD domain-containing protein n=1 Tax=Arabis alpina TaxID=50452 RepID=A0A087HIK9_ARAAL|nr:hypothetical protein AALP_AA2G194400 [Arabis alpina]
MGDDEQSPSQQSPHTQNPSQSQSPETLIPIPPETTTNEDDNSSASSTGVSGSIVSSTTIETQRVTELTNVSSPLSKIPLRPRKIRKLSSPEGKSSQSRSITVPRIHARSLNCEGELEAAFRHLRNVDPLLGSLIDIHQPPTFESFHTPFLALIRSILFQQLAAKAGNSIYTRFVALCGGENCVVPETVLPLTAQELRQIGVSGRKASYLNDLARKYQKGILSDSGIVNMDEKSLFTMLTMVNGIGSWSVHMFMINSLQRPDVLPVNDLSVRKGVQMLYSLKELPRPSQMEKLCENWRPYRSVGTWYMWRFMEAKATPSNAAAAAVTAGAPLSFPQLEDIQQQQQQQHQQQQSQLMDPLNSVFSIGAWGQT